MKPSIITLFSLGILRLSCAVQHLSANCTIVATSDARIDILDESYEETVFKCDGDGFSYRLELPTAEKDHMMQLLDGGNLVINESILLNTDVIVEGDAIISFGVQPWSFGSNESQGRRHSEQGNKPILAVRVTDVNGLVHPNDAATIGDNIFGTLDDPVNLKSQMFACSFGQLNIVNEYSVDIKQHLAAPGVIEVDIGISLTTNDRYTIHDAITAAVENKLGFSLPGPFEQVMYVIEKCYVGCGWAAYAYVNSWMSVYQADYYSQAGVQMHEIGHNFGFAHSGGLNGATYTDHTCQMGNPLYGDDLGKMCYNPAKNWAIGWYDSRKSEVDISKNVINHIETIVGVADFGNNPDQRNVIIKLETGTSNDYFVGFNRATGINSQNDEADNEVTIIKTGANGESYSQSFLQATLTQGEYWALNGMVITAEEINVNSNPGTATVSIRKGSSPTPPTIPTNSPVKSPVPIRPTPAPQSTPRQKPTNAPQTQPTPPTSTECRTLCCFPIDNDDNGGWANNYMLQICEEQGCHYEMWPNGKPYCSGRDFYYDCVSTTCNSPTVSPVKSPIKPPTTSPVRSPVKPPTVSPVRSPIKSPTASPQVAPTGTCLEDGKTKFLMKAKVKKNGELKVASRNCSWLSSRKTGKMEKLCKKKMRCHENFGSAEDMCPETCGTCDPCYQSDKALFYVKTKGQNVIVRSCAWLSKKNDIDKRCQKTKRSSCYAPASEVCPQTCSTCTDRGSQW